MKSMNDRKSPRLPAGSPARRPRFRIEKLEERIAPKGNPGTQQCEGTVGNPRITQRCS
jgi:hypothetical protein